MAKTNADTVTEMTTKPVGRLIIKLAVPTIITMMVTAIYNTADTFFVSQIGTEASGAVGVIFSLMTMIQAGGFMIGMGSGSITSRALGHGDLKKASVYCSTALVFAFSLGTLLLILGTIFNEPLIRSLEATETILPYAQDYGRYILFACPFMMTSFVMNNQLRFQGKAAFAMVGMVTGGILNMFLDPLFIFVFKLGISGAAIATLVSQFTSFCILSWMFVFKRSAVEFSFKNTGRRLSIYTDIITTGLPSLFRQGMSSVSSIFMNLGAARYGALLTGFAIAGTAMTTKQTADAAVAGMAITNRICMLLMSVAIGVGQGFQPVCGMNLGAKKYDRVRQAVSFMIKLNTILMTIFAIVVFIFAPQLTKSFRDDPAVIAVATLALRFSCCVLPFHSIIFGTNMLLQVAGVKIKATVLSSMRQGIVFVPVILLLPLITTYFFSNGILGIQLTPAVSDLISALIALPFMIIYLKNLGKEK